MKEELAQKKVKVDNELIERAIARWMKSKGWKTDDFYKFLELGGVKTPVILSNFRDRTVRNITFDCLSNEGKFVIRIGRECSCNILSLTKDGITNKYAINEKTFDEWTPRLIPQGRTLQRENKILESTYTNVCGLWINNYLQNQKYLLKIVIGGKYSNSHKKIEIYESIEKYIFDLEIDFDVDDVYDTIVQLMHLSETELNTSNIFIELYETETDILRVVIDLCEGQLEKYGVWDTKRNETVILTKSGDWCYITKDGQKIDYKNPPVGKKLYTLEVRAEELLSNLNESFNFKEQVKYAERLVEKVILPKFKKRQQR